MEYVVYILKCADDTLYTGVTNDLSKRIENHNTGKTGAKYTRARRPVELLYHESVGDRGAAQKREAEIKKMTRDQKITLVNLPK